MFWSFAMVSFWGAVLGGSLGAFLSPFELGASMTLQLVARKLP